MLSNPALVDLMEEARPVAAGPTWRFGLPGLVAMGLLGGFVWYSGVSFLRLRAWARISLEAISWLALVAFLGIGVYLIRLFIGLPEIFFFSGLDPSARVPLGPVLLATCGIAVVVLIVMIGFLRGNTIREAVGGSR